MKEPYLSRPLARDVCNLFKLKAPRDGVTAYDCLGLPEDADEAAIKQHVDQRTEGLRRSEDEYRTRGDNDTAAGVKHLVEVFTSLASTFASAATRQEYDRNLEDARLRKFQQAVTPLLTPGREPTPEEDERILAVAVDYRLDKKRARQFILELLGVDRSGNEYARLGVTRFGSDPTWPTSFDLLLLSEDVTDRALIQAQRQAQMSKIEKLRQSPDQDEKRLARTLEERLDEAAAVLADDQQRQAYLKELHAQRIGKFQEEIQLYVPHGTRPEIDTLLQLIDLGQALRIPEDLVRREITKLTGFSDFMSLIAERKRPLLGSPDGLSFHVTDPDNPQQLTQTLAVNNDGADRLKGELRSNEDWIRVTPQTLDTTGSQVVSVSIDPSHLKPGIPSAGTVEVNSNGGIRRITITAILEDTGIATNRRDKVAAALTYALGGYSIGIVPIAMFFYYEKRSTYVATQAAQSGVINVAATLVAFCSALFAEVCLLRLVAKPLLYASIAVLIASFFLFIPAAMGKRLRLPYVYPYTQRFIRQRGTKKE